MDQSRLRELADEFGTPLYVTDTELVRCRYNRLDDALPFCEVKYASKANFDPQVLTALAAEGASFVAGSSQEAMVAFNNGIPANELQVTVVSPKDVSVEQLVYLANQDDNFTATVNSLDTFKELDSNGYQGNVLLRLKPSADLRAESKYRDGALLKFGMTTEEIESALIELDKSDATFIGFHCHLGGSVSPDTLDNYCDHIEYTIDKATNHEPLDNIDVLNFGGGLGIPYEPDDEPFDLDELSERLSEVLPNDERTTFVIEPGRYIVGPAARLLTKVKTIRNQETGRFVGVDAGMAEFSRPTFHPDVYHKISLLGDAEEREEVRQTVAGPTCSGTDLFCHNRRFERLQVGDIAQLHNVGAYGFVMATNFHAYDSPRMVTLDGEESPRMRELVSQQGKN